ncbi:malate dehydrogenase (quinone) [Tolumonas lignilytica]|uniref:malate dehydrogenase (quinone) n=1 Tax=Tolumonas lignilytica TaxID=1283284 RepID=UPI000464A692|nr:malate dehydrogenase (quinone) [Tolumonas lignilytica]
MASIHADVTLVGGGIMSATLAMLIHRLDPSLHICMIEKLPEIALESSQALNNAGTGHAGYCELNYTPQDKQGQIQIQRALEINAAFEVSLQFWSHLIHSDNQNLDPAEFINRVPHLSAVWGDKNIDYLKARYTALKSHHLFSDMQWADDQQTLLDWMPLMMQGRGADAKLAATRVEHGADVNFGALTRIMVGYLQKHANFELMTSTKVTHLHRKNDLKKCWVIKAKKQNSVEKFTIESPFVFLGAGGIALHLLQQSGIKEAAGYGGFPVSGQWLICQNQDLIQQHHAKVYSLAAVDAPPMSVPHLDTRIINGKPSLLFGPYAGFTTKFLKHGSRLDLMKSVKTHNLKSLIGAGKDNLDLTKYLIKEVLQTHSQRMSSLQAFVPNAHADDWQLAHAGKRVQIIKQCDKKWGKLEFGTEIVASEDGSLAALLGASPGASVSVKTMLAVLERCFPQQVQSAIWQDKIKTMIPSYGSSLITDAQLLGKIRKHTLTTLKLSS